jgi:hypothetical protein
MASPQDLLDKLQQPVPVQRTQSAPPPKVTIQDASNPDSEPKTAHPDSFPFQHSFHDSWRNSSKQGSWHHRKRSPGVEWHNKLTKESFNNGRVLLIDYVSRDHTEEGRRKIVAQEFHNVEGLRRFYANQDLSHQAALRLIHVQSAP